MSLQRNFAGLDKGPFDLLVLGGGIVGAWTAYDAALRGLKVALVEKCDWGSGTSSASSKLIHGGLRYLEYFDFKVVRHSVRERRTLARLGPHRVWPLRFVIPVYRESRVGPFKFGLGLTLYDLLAGGNQPVKRHAKISVLEIEKYYPFLNTDSMRCGFTYGDCQTDDARFVLEVVDGAQTAGATTANYAKALEILSTRGTVQGARIEDQLTGDTIEVHAKVTVNATGVWGGLIPGFQPGAPARYRMTKGVHLSLPPLPTQEALLLTARSDQRVFFVIPWYGRTILGTTDTDYEGDPDQVAVEEADIHYLIEEANHSLQGVHWSAEDVQGSWAGLRMLKHAPNKPPGAVSRKWFLYQHEQSLLMPVGGKYTTAREDASLIVDAAGELLGKKTSCATSDRLFPWCPEAPFAEWQEKTARRGQQAGLDAETAVTCASRYGGKMEALMQHLEKHPDQAARIIPDLPFCRAEIHYAAAHEMAVHPEDIWRRRIPLEILGPLTEEVKQEVRTALGGTK